MDYDKGAIFDQTEYKKHRLVEKFLNKIFNKFKIKITTGPLLNNGTDMVSIYQRINFFHLLNRVLQNGVKGDIVELGCFDGQIATLFQYINEQNKANRKVYLFDNFKNDFGLKTSIKDRLIYNFKSRNLTMPEIVEGDFKETLMNHLPEQICFAHFDSGIGKDPQKHKQVILGCLNAVYPRMTSGAIGVMMDYYEKNRTVNGLDSNPGVKLACDEFFRDKTENVFTLYGGEYSHGYFVKS